MRGLQKYARNWNPTVVFWATCKIGQLIQPIWQHFFCPVLVCPQKVSLEFIFLQSYRQVDQHEKLYQMFWNTFWGIQLLSRNVPCCRKGDILDMHSTECFQLTLMMSFWPNGPYHLIKGPHQEIFWRWFPAFWLFNWK